jgi:hypothetical protein
MFQILKPKERPFPYVKQNLKIKFKYGPGVHIMEFSLVTLPGPYNI